MGEATQASGRQSSVAEQTASAAGSSGTYTERERERVGG